MFNIMKGTASTLNYENRYELRNRTAFTIQSVNPVRYGLESLSYLGRKCWETMPLDLSKLNRCQNLKLKLRNGILKIVHADIARHLNQTYLNQTYKIETF